ncbi:glycosyl hydrolase [Echinicola vietnamensis]|uniref:Glycosyl hydrolases family 2,F5/8 type C domain-containing protein n=1 Tax=Echinicola vietnamensis (strain DSM 17526 / LMG 23754 / KMM 6221) TaxID=926556 RepID=L0FVP1_ECHVK|nr:glycosyl hydrolase [Echinicola vietnamensis]AGA77964.1 glycosyl hydrolases family 2,F5/8 type C domain-containing protein [Echinicola vietnamensis DSM 17526]
MSSIKTQHIICLLLFTLLAVSCGGSAEEGKDATDDFKPTYETSQPWVYWYWMYSTYSKEGITADLEAMKEAGIGGAFLMSIKGPATPPLTPQPTLQGSEAWWEMVHHAMKEADRLGLRLAMHACDGFAVAGGPWITPEKSMQKVVWTDTLIQGGAKVDVQLNQPESYEDYYRELAVFAFPVKAEWQQSSETLRPRVTNSFGDQSLEYLLDDADDQRFGTNDEAWIQYAFEKPFTCRSIRIKTSGNSYQAHRLKIAVSDDGEHFREVTRLTPPRHGWQDWDYDYTHSIPATTAKYFRFIYDKSGTEPGAEDLDAAKWKPSLKVKTIALSSRPTINQYEGKSGAVWRVSERADKEVLPSSECVPLDQLVDVSDQMDANGRLVWDAPDGEWKVMRFGYTSTGHTNYTGGGAKGLEVDKFNAEAVKFQFDQWFGEALRTAGPELAEKVLKIFHIDSWEAGSQNWSPVFREEFKKRRGYDMVSYLPVMAGVPLESAETSERLLYDLRRTISEVVMDNFFGTLQAEATKNDVKFSSENVAPTMVSDGMEHFKYIDYPSGEFWLNSPTHDKPNDMRDAISGGHIYGKQIIQAEAYTELRMDWDEYPGMLKALGDRNYALGINRFFYHVFVHNPWLDRKPGMTLDVIGLYFQRDQTWWKPGKAMVDYHQRVQYQLQKGHPVIDLAVFTGEDLPSRSVLPERLVPFLPGPAGKEKMAAEKARWANEDQPTRVIPKGVKHSANMADAADWTDPLRGYHYDSFNKDAFLTLAKVEDGKVVFGKGTSYSFLVFPGQRKMNPNARLMSVEVAEKLLQLVKEGATVLVGEEPRGTLGYQEDESRLAAVVQELWAGEQNASQQGGHPKTWQVGKGKVVQLPYQQATFEGIGLAPDVVAVDQNGKRNAGFAFAHRRSGTEDVYFLSNQQEETRRWDISFRVSGKRPVFYDAVLDREYPVSKWKEVDGRTVLPVQLPANGSLFVIFREDTAEKAVNEGDNWPTYSEVQPVSSPWEVAFDPDYRGPHAVLEMTTLEDWSSHANDSIKYYSGTAVYKTSFDWNKKDEGVFWLHLGEVANIASVKVNGKDCGIAWTFPYQVDISDALRNGQNELEIAVTNTWANRIIGDLKLPEAQRFTNTIADLERMEGREPLEAGLLGPVRILEQNK